MSSAVTFERDGFVVHASYDTGTGMVRYQCGPVSHTAIVPNEEEAEIKLEQWFKDCLPFTLPQVVRFVIVEARNIALAGVRSSSWDPKNPDYMLPPFEKKTKKRRK